jgi:hypothetical protein
LQVVKLAQYKGTDLLPKTKDGHHELVFPTDFSHNHGLQIRAALEGRLIWELLSIAGQDPDRLKKMSDRYCTDTWCDPKYPLLEDPEGFASKISIPHIGLIKPGQKTGLRCFQSSRTEVTEGNQMVGPFAPISCYYKLHSGEYIALPFRILNEDSYGIKNVGSRFSDASLEHVAIEQAKAETPEMQHYFGEEEAEGYCHLEARVRTALGRVRRLDELLKSDLMVCDLRDISMRYVWFSLFNARVVLNREDSEFDFMFTRFDGYCSESSLAAPGEQGHTSVSLTKRIAASAAALCTEYLSEMA